MTGLLFIAFVSKRFLIMSYEQSKKRQINIENLKTALNNAFRDDLVKQLDLLKFPHWYIYYRDGTDSGSNNFDCFTNAAIYSMLKSRM